MLVWLSSGDPRLNDSVRAALADQEQKVSVVTAYEYVDLYMRGRFPAAMSFDRVMARFHMDVADLPADAMTQLHRLPPIHRDPIDRMLILHAIATGSAIVTADNNIRRYPVATIW